jgi:hypothetical protein
MENEGILRIPPETVQQAGLILLFDGEVATEVESLWLSVERNAFLLSLNLQLSTINYLQRRAQPNRYPDFGLIPPSRLPDLHQWLMGICSRYSGATVPDFHRVP